MTSRWIINLLILATAVVLALIAWYEPGIEPPVGSRPITGLATEQVERIEVVRPLREDLVLRRDSAGGWLLDREPELPADPVQVRSLAKLVEQRAVRSYAAEHLDLPRLALDPSYASITLNDIRIESGSLEPLQELRYVRINDQVHLISDMYQHLIDADYTQFVQRRLFSESARINELNLPGLRLYQSDGKWQVEPQQPVSADAIQQLVENWQQAKARYVKAAGADSDSAEVISVSLDDSDQTVEFIVVSREPELILRRSDHGIDYQMGSSGNNLLRLPEPATENPA
ncbi:MAG: DUF4340 domain-containing protein [Thiogranum sp.]|nr:DUF4340 domain-containing protein [Thiogranum sp.]